MEIICQDRRLMLMSGSIDFNDLEYRGQLVNHSRRSIGYNKILLLRIKI